MKEILGTTDIIATLKAANELIHLFRNEPNSVTNYARQVDPVINALRIATYEMEQVLIKEDS